MCSALPLYKVVCFLTVTIGVTLGEIPWGNVWTGRRIRQDELGHRFPLVVVNLSPVCRLAYLYTGVKCLITLYSKYGSVRP